jgi:HAD superfamily hydrolase (TIGR01509 family)
MELDHFKTWLFDMDGTLVSSTGGVITCMQGVIRDLGGDVPTSVDLSAAFGTGLEQTIMPWVRPDQVDGAVQMYLDRFQDEVAGRVDYLPGSRELLVLLRDSDVRMSIVTGANEREVHHIFEVTGLAEYLPEHQVVHADSLKHRKPSPEPVLEAMRRLKGDRESTIFVGDSEHDITAGKLAGVYTVGVLGGSSTEEKIRDAEPDLIVNSLEELIDELGSE